MVSLIGGCVTMTATVIGSVIGVLVVLAVTFVLL